MTDNHIVRISQINRPAVESGQYTLALLLDGCQAGIIDQESVNGIHNEILDLLKDLIIKFTQDKSSSVRAETAQHLLESLLYAIDAATISFEDPADAVIRLKNVGVKQMYAQGLDLVMACVGVSRFLYRNIKANKLSMGTHAYNLTIDEALAGFFDTYDPIFHAQDTMASIDYPLLFDDMSITGIFYIKQYLEKLGMENDFCRLCNPASATRLLQRYGQVYAIDYRDTLLNLFEVMLTNAVFSVLVGNAPLELGVLPTQYELLRQRLIGASKEECAKLINESLEGIIRVLPVQPIGLADYIRKFTPLLMPKFWSGLQNDTLPNVMIIDSAVSHPAEIIFSQGHRMDDDNFRLLVEQLVDCPSGSTKATLISSSVHSLEDFIDVLEAECLFEGEFIELYDTLGDLELSLLARIVFVEEVRAAGPNFSLQRTLEKAAENEWQTAYVIFLQSLSLTRLASIQNLVHSF